MPFVMKTALRILLINQTLQIKVFLFLAEQIAAATDNEIDDELVEILRASLGGVDTADIRAGVNPPPVSAKK